MSIDVDRPYDQRTRTEVVLSNMRSEWSARSDGLRFFEAIYDFLRMRQNSNSRRTYNYSILEFFEWSRGRRGITPTPNDVTRADAAAYTTYLGERDRGLEREWLMQDRDRRLDLLIYDLVAAAPGIRVNTLRQEVATRMPELVVVRDGVKWLQMDADFMDGRAPCFDEHLACLVHARTLRREPSLSDIREGRVEVPGVSAEQASQVGIGVEIDPEIFRYYPVVRTGRGAERAGTVSTRINVLSSLWDHLIQSGENRPGAESLLKYNVWKESLARVVERARTQAKTSRVAKTPDENIFLNLLATTFTRLHKEQARAEAELTITGADIDTAGTSVRDLRDRLVLLILGQVGARRSEVGQILRRDVTLGDPKDPSSFSTVVLTGKRNKQRRIRLPWSVHFAYAALSNRLVDMVRRDAAHRAFELLQPDSPAVPHIKDWGANREQARDHKLSGPAIAMMLRRRALEAGYDARGAEFKQIHAHGFRRLFANMAIELGTQMNKVQAILGHESGATTAIYTEEVRPEKLIATHLEHRPPSQEPVVAPAPAVIPAVPMVVVPAVPMIAVALRPAETPSRPQVVASPGVLKRSKKGAEGTGAVPPASKRAEPKAVPTVVAAEAPAAPGVIKRSKKGEAEVAPAPKPKKKSDRLLLAPSGMKGAAPNIYVSKDSRLVWWDGRGEELADDPMPLMSPRQTSQCSSPESVCGALGALWQEFAETKGPTATFALTAWVHDALSQSASAAKLVLPGFWLPFEVPLITEPEDVREHSVETIVAWFRKRAWEHHTSQKGHQTEPFENLPAWFDEGDPIQSLPPLERDQLLEWLTALQGTTPKMLGARKDAATVISALCSYDFELTDYREAKVAAAKAGSGERVDSTNLKVMAEHTDRIVRRYDPTFSVKQFTDDRTKAFGLKRWEGERRLKREEAEGVSLKKRTKGGAGMTNDASYLKLVEKLFGEEVANDTTIQLLARCGRGMPLNDSVMKDLFHVDPVTRTITHTPTFAREFTDKTRQHSECVARRIARELWELKKKKKLPMHKVVPTIWSMRAFRVPCPRELEAELRQRLGEWYTPLVFKEDWDAYSATEQQAQLLEEQERLFKEEARGRRTPASEYAGGMAEGSFGIIGKKFQPNSAQFTRMFINPVICLAMLYA